MSFEDDCTITHPETPTERSFLDEVSKAVPVVLALSTLISYTAGVSLEQSRRNTLGITLLAAPSSEQYLFKGGLLIGLLFYLLLGASGFIVSFIKNHQRRLIAKNLSRTNKYTFLILVVILCLFLAMLIGGELGEHVAHTTRYPVVTLSRANNSNGENEEFLFLGSDDKQIAVVAKPNVAKHEARGHMIYISRADIKGIVIKSYNDIPKFTNDWK